MPANVPGLDNIPKDLTSRPAAKTASPLVLNKAWKRPQLKGLGSEIKDSVGSLRPLNSPATFPGPALTVLEPWEAPPALRPQDLPDSEVRTEVEMAIDRFEKRASPPAAPPSRPLNVSGIPGADNEPVNTALVNGVWQTDGSRHCVADSLKSGADI